METENQTDQEVIPEEESSRLKQELAAAFAGLFGLLVVLAGISTAIILAAAFHLADHHAIWH